MGVTHYPTLASFYPLYAQLLHRFTSITPLLLNTNYPTPRELFEKYDSQPQTTLHSENNFDNFSDAEAVSQTANF